MTRWRCTLHRWQYNEALCPMCKREQRAAALLIVLIMVGIILLQHGFGG